jgi:hypothetical protein
MYNSRGSFGPIYLLFFIFIHFFLLNCSYIQESRLNLLLSHQLAVLWFCAVIGHITCHPPAPSLRSTDALENDIDNIHRLKGLIKLISISIDRGKRILSDQSVSFMKFSLVVV